MGIMLLYAVQNGIVYRHSGMVEVSKIFIDAFCVEWHLACAGSEPQGMLALCERAHVWVLRAYRTIREQLRHIPSDEEVREIVRFCHQVSLLVINEEMATGRTLVQRKQDLWRSSLPRERLLFCKNFFEIFPSIGGSGFCHLFRSSLCDNLSSTIPSFGSEIQKIIS